MARVFPYGWGLSPQTLQQITGLTEPQFRVLLEAVTGSEGFERSLARCEALANQLKADLKRRDVFELLSSLWFLYSRCRQWERDARDCGTALREFLELTGMDEGLGDEGVKRLLQLTAKNPTVDRRQKLRWLRTGILNTGVDFASFVDVRPSISEDRRAIQELVPVVILRINTESGSGEVESHVFQLTPEGLTKLRAILDDVEKKLNLVVSDPLFGPRVDAEAARKKDEEEEW